MLVRVEPLDRRVEFADRSPLGFGQGVEPPELLGELLAGLGRHRGEPFELRGQGVDGAQGDQGRGQQAGRPSAAGVGRDGPRVVGVHSAASFSRVERSSARRNSRSPAAR